MGRHMNWVNQLTIFSSLSFFFIPRREKFMLQRIILSDFKLEKMRRVFAALV